jgi:hypothetical protein
MGMPISLTERAASALSLDQVQRMLRPAVYDTNTSSPRPSEKVADGLPAHEKGYTQRGCLGQPISTTRPGTNLVGEWQA